jgi:hypothetical protein
MGSEESPGGAVRSQRIERGAYDVTGFLHASGFFELAASKLESLSSAQR